MVQTRSASGVDVPPTPTPARPRSSAGRSTRRSKAATPTTPTVDETETPTTPTTPPTKAVTATTTATTTIRGWSYAPDLVTRVWLAISLPLVIWDTGYILLRPLSMPGGSLHWPLWAPYALYGEIDYVYGARAFDAGSGFPAAQGTLNLVETALYLAAVALWATASTSPRRLTGRPAAWAALLIFAAAVMTLSKTVLYWLHEYYSGFSQIGHNDVYTLITMWIVPNGLWLIFPSILIYNIGGELLDGLASAPAPKTA